MLKSPSCKTQVCARGMFRSYVWRTALKGARPKQAQTVAGTRQTAKATKEIL